LAVRNVAGQLSPRPLTVHTKNISSSGAYFLYPEWIEPGTPVAIEVSLLVQRRRHRAVRMCTDAHVVRAQPGGKPGWHGLAVAFDDIRFVRGDYSLSHSGLSVTVASS
jgi:hypothetical protein